MDGQIHTGLRPPFRQVALFTSPTILLGGERAWVLAGHTVAIVTYCATEKITDVFTNDWTVF